GQVGLAGDKAKMPAELSGGMRKRAGLARALVLEPKILLADEPSSGLDRITASEIDELLLKQKAENQTTLIVVSHDVHGVRRVGGMDAGEVLDIGVPDSPPSRFRVKWRINAKLRGLVRADSVVTIETEGVVGGTYVSVRPGSARAPEAAALATIPSREPIELS